MKYFKTLFMFVAFSLLCLASAAPLPDAVVDARDSVFRIATYKVDSTRRTFQCTGFVAKSPLLRVHGESAAVEFPVLHYFVTAAHCADAMTKTVSSGHSEGPFLVFEDGSRSELTLLARCNVLNKCDHAVYVGAALNDLPALEFANPPTVGDELFVWSFPGANGPFISSGHYGGLAGGMPDPFTPRSPLPYADINVATGSSGAPILNAQGQVVGITHSIPFVNTPPGYPDIGLNRIGGVYFLGLPGLQPGLFVYEDGEQLEVEIQGFSPWKGPADLNFLFDLIADLKDMFGDGYISSTISTDDSAAMHFRPVSR